MVNISYWVNEKTRLVSMTTGPIDASEMKREGFKPVDGEAEMQAFRDDTQKLIAAGWSKSPRTLKKYLHVLEAK